MPSNKFKLKFKLEGLELEIEGSREDVPLITQAVGNQIAGMLAPAAEIVEGEIVSQGDDSTNGNVSISSSPTKPKNRRSPKRKNNSSSTSVDNVINWKHDARKYGMPQQDWTGAQKAMWLLFVVSKETSSDEMSVGQITATFDAHFKQAKKPANVARDLGKLKLLPNTPIAQDTTKFPNTWFLTQEGERQIKELISEILGK